MNLRGIIKGLADQAVARVPELRNAAGPEIATAHVADASRELTPAPLPAEWIVDGDPQPRALELFASEDGRMITGLWDCPAGTFDYTFLWGDEVVHILDGEVTVSEPGRTYELRPGSVAFFPYGMTARWHVPRYVKKQYVLRAPMQSHLATLRRKLGV